MAAPAGSATESVRVLFMSTPGGVADIYRSYLPEGWELDTLRSRDDTDDIRARLARADAVIHTDVTLTRELVESAPRLRIVHRQGVGLDSVDHRALQERGIPLCICPVGTPEAVAEHTILLMLAVGRHLVALHDGVSRQRGWPKWEYRSRSITLHRSTVGVVGFGRTGQALARRLLAFGSRMLVAPRAGRPLGGEWPPEQVALAGDLDELFERSDIVSLHCPLTPETRGLVDAAVLARMPEHAILVNTGRGGLVVEEDLAEAVAEGRIAGAGLDVLSSEPPPAGHPLLGIERVLITPHTAAGTRHTQEAKAEAILENIGRVLAGEEPRFRVDSSGQPDTV